jgi:putative transposase
VVDPGEGDAVYHCMSRTVGGDFLLGEEEKEVMRRQMWALAEYCGVQVVTYALLSNHFHLLVRVPQRRAVSDHELLKLFRGLYPRLKPGQDQKLTRVIESMANNGPEARAWRAKQVRQMFSVSSFMKLFKMRFSIWYNASHGRKGTLWSERFKSVLVEDGDALRAMAAYIDLNSVRAGLAGDPKDYRFCGYAEAVAGNHKAQQGLGSLYGQRWTDCATVYRCILFARGAEAHEGKRCIPQDEVRQARETGGTLPLGTLLRCRIRYFTDGAVLGSNGFVAAQISRLQEKGLLGKRAAPHPLNPLLGCDNFRVLSHIRDGAPG